MSLVGISITMLLISTATVTEGCIFDCKNTSACGGFVPAHVNASFLSGEWNEVGGVPKMPDDYDDDVHPYYGEELAFTESGVLHALDLRNRGITAIATGGLDCYMMDPGDYSMASPNSAMPAHYNGSYTQAILLDDNKLDTIPNMADFGGCPVVSMSGNSIASLPAGVFSTFDGPWLSFYCIGCSVTTLQSGMLNGTVDTASPTLKSLFLYLQNNSVATLPAGVFASSFLDGVKVFLDDNKIGALGARVFSGYAGSYAAFYFQWNQIAVLDQDMLVDFDGSNLYIFAEHNQVSAIPLNMFNNVATGQLFLHLEYNRVETLQPQVFDNYLGAELGVYLETQDPPMRSLPDQLLAGFWGTQLSLSVQHNAINSLGRLFFNCSFAGHFYLWLGNNNVSSTEMANAMGSWVFQQPPFIHLNAVHNAIDALPPKLFAKCSDGAAFTVASTVQLVLAHNPIKYISPTVFETDPAPRGLGTAQFTTRLFVDISSPTAGVPDFPDVFSFAGPLLASATSMMQLNFSMTGACHCLVDSLLGFTGETLAVDLSHNNISSIDSPVSRPRDLVLILNLSHNNLMTTANLSEVAGVIDLSYNQITSTANGSFGGHLVSLNLSHNRLQTMNSATFSYSFELRELLLSNNSLTQMHTEFFDHTPGLTTLHIDHNEIRALPVTQNRIANPQSAIGNPLRCDTYGPSACDCLCPPNQVPSYHCGYIRCTANDDGCPYYTISNSSDCSLAPWSVCVKPPVPGFYYNTLQRAFEPLTVCETRFKRDGRYLPSYEFSKPTSTADRLCGICSECPDGFHTQPCTVTSDTRCTKSYKLGIGDVASIAVSAFLLLLIGFLGWNTARRYYHKRNKVATELEMTTEELLNVTEEKDRIREEKNRMAEAWKIPVADISLDKRVAEGSFGAVWRGRWGTQTVAIKVLKRVVSDELDLDAAEGFRAECSTLESIRHPNLLIFFGAGVTPEGEAFMVTEWMELGSLRAVLADSLQPLHFDLRAVIAVQIAKGMRHLHKVSIVHRDLKSDNVLLDAHYNAKIADFGTSKFLAGSTRMTHSGDLHDNGGGGAPAEDEPAILCHNAVMTRGVGTTVWMAPEIFVGEKEYGPEVDAYSFGIILWELATRRWPWDELNATSYITLFQKLDTALRNGQRPSIPPEFCASHPVYTKTMRACWANDPSERPTFDAVVFSLETICSIGGEAHADAAVASRAQSVPGPLQGEAFDDGQPAQWRFTTDRHDAAGCPAGVYTPSGSSSGALSSGQGHYHSMSQPPNVYEGDETF